MNKDKQNPLERLPDDEILNLIHSQADFEKGFKELMSKYQEKVYWHIRRMVENHDDANDIIQNTFIKVYRNIGKFEGNSRLYTWIYRIATNETLTFLKKQKRVVILPIDNYAQELEMKGSFLDNISASEIQIKLERALDELPERQRMVFDMRYFEEMSYKEISQNLEISVGALKASYHHAVKKIEAFIRKTGSF